MNVKQKLRKFFTLTRTADGGFTLVELIVVIAILAILAGVAVPAYNGYIKKARESADYQIIAAANTAFASACLESKIDVENVTDAAVSVIGQKVYGMSSVNVKNSADTSKIASAFNRYYVGNEEAVFQTENVNSLQWNPDKDTFEMDATFVPATITLSNGKTITISAEDMKAIQNSAYADMGYKEVADLINDLNKSSNTLYSIASLAGKGDRLTAALLAYGIVSTATEAENLTAEQVGNGLQLVTAMNIADKSPEEIAELVNKKLTVSVPIFGEIDTAAGLIDNLSSSGGADTIASVALQYALVEGFSNTEAGQNTSISYKSWGKTYSYDSVEQFLASDAAKEDPVWAINQVKKQSAYQTYVTGEQGQKDLDGFVGTLAVVGNNAASTKNPSGAIDVNDYLNDGIYSQDAEDVLSAVLGS